MASKGEQEQCAPAAHKRTRHRRGKTTPGLPDPKSVIAEQSFISPKGNRYRILTTTETDPYDPPVSGKKRGSRAK